MRSLVVVLILVGCVRAESGKDTTRSEVRGQRSEASASGDSARISRLTPRPAPVPVIPDTPALGPRPSALPVALIVGTSLTAGLGLDPDEAYPALLQRKADSAGFRVRIVNAGLSGETSAGALRRIDWLLRDRADIVMIETGANDGLRGLDVDSTRANLRAILRKVRAAKPGALLFLAQMESPPNLGNSYTSRFRDMFPTVAREEGATLVPFLLEGVAAVRRLNQGDGIHPNREGERIVADNVWRTLAPALGRIGRMP